ncbi:uncharacterized protein LOC130778545 isoform X1 [Actinidia eriantha]|uniref:uncharacterized protein LOC130778545 isoform X1 n=1 Tax=Actinidia eriantha TaxID=165200 RepID=UPI00258438BA|nr:uncharacterized protein LOC130778545 isoform X1 [Actinidia eriantha]
MENARSFPPSFSFTQPLQSVSLAMSLISVSPSPLPFSLSPPSSLSFLYHNAKEQVQSLCIADRVSSTSKSSSSTWYLQGLMDIHCNMRLLQCMAGYYGFGFFGFKHCSFICWGIVCCVTVLGF